MQQLSSPLINGVWTTDTFGCCKQFLDQVPGLLPSPRGLLLTDWIRSLHPEDGACAAMVVAAAVDKRQPFRHKFRILCSSGKSRYVVLHGMLQLGTGGKWEGYSGAITDITLEHEELELALKSETEHRLIMDNSMDLIAHCTPDGRYTYVSSSYTHYFDWEVSEMLGRRAIEFLHPDDHTNAQAGFDHIVQGGCTPDALEVRKRRRDGQYLVLGTKIRKVTDPVTGQITGAVLVSRDITREKEMLHRLARMAEQNTALIESSPDIMMMLDSRGTVLHVNKAVENILGYPVGEVLGQAGLDWICSEVRQQTMTALLALAQGETEHRASVPCLRSDGRVVHLDLSFCRPPESEMVYATARDISENRRTRLAVEAAHARVRSILESIDDGFFSVNKNWEITFANTIAADFVGVILNEAIGKVVWDVAPGLAQSDIGAIYRHAMHSGQNAFVEALYEPVGAWVSVRAYAHEDGLSVFFHDISDRVRNDMILRESELRLRQMIELTPAGYVLTDAEGIIKQVNPALSLLTGFEREELIGSRISALLENGDSALNPSKDSNAAHALETVIRHKHGYMVYALVNQTIERDNDGRARLLTAFVTDITERKHAEARLEQLATRDPLTGLPNRTWLNEHLGIMLSSEGSDTATVLFIDLDRFKEVNDSLGHAAGDLLLQQVSARLQSCMRPGDVVARLGGDEFVVATSCYGQETAASIAQRLLTSLTRPFHVDGLEIFVGASIGISLADEKVNTPARLFQNADTAMYQAKIAGGSSFCFFDPEMNVAAKRRLQIEMAMRQALELGQFTMYYQPRIDLHTMQLCSMEALLRWTHPQLGCISPLEFIPVAEERGHIEMIGQWVLQQACRETKRLCDEYGMDLHVSVNISARQLRSSSLIDEVQQALHESGLASSALELELTESALIEDIEHSAALLRQLKSLGVRVSIDDFGTGYSSLSYLKRFPVDVLKLDRSFFHEQSVGNECFIKAIIDMAHALGLTVVAEGIETGTVAETLRHAACDQGQGYLFAKPMAVNELEHWLLCQAS